MAQGLDKAVVLGVAGTLEELTRSGLRDRDYESLSTAGRLQTFGLVAGEGKRIVCDCVDQEPGLTVSRLLLASEAEAVLEGAFVAAVATGAVHVVVHLAEDDQVGAEPVARAVEEVRACEARAREVTVELVRGPFRPNLKGYEDVPTLVMTAETLLNISRVLREGAEAFRRTGTPASPGTKFFQVSGRVKKPGIFEVPLGTTLRQLIEEACGGMAEDEELQVIVVGGSHGACYTESELDLPLDFDSASRSGGVIGWGGVVVLGHKDCIIDQVRRMMGFLCHGDCGRCSLGREGSYQLREIVTDMTRGKSRASDLEMLREIGEAMRLGCACAAGRTAPNLVLSTLAKFPGEYEAHMKRKKCGALVCAKYVTFHILPELCDGCGACRGECPEEAIEGGKGLIHVIDQDSCDQCGKCYEVCSDLRRAVAKSGPVKPRTPQRPIPVGSWKS
jgi:NADH:ubiquinone oxidoreductase subunit F (NADH-binding)/ferredoxin